MSAVSSGGGSALIYKLDCPTHLQNDTFLTFLYSAQLQSPLASVSADLKAWQPSPPSLPSPLFLTEFSLSAVLSDPALISPSFSNCDGYELVSSTAWHGGHTDNWSVNIGRIHTHTHSRHGSTWTQQQNNHRQHVYVKRAMMPSVLCFSLSKLSVWWLMCNSTNNDARLKVTVDPKWSTKNVILSWELSMWCTQSSVYT